MNLYQLWKIWHRFNGYQHFLFKSGVSHKYLDMMLDWDYKVDGFNRYVGDCKLRLTSNEIDELRREFGETEAFNRRKEFLSQKLDAVNTYIARYYERYEINRRRDLKFWLRSLLESMWNIQKFYKYQKKIQMELYLLENRGNSSITPEIVAKAREFPMENLFEFNRFGFAKCPYHNEKTPSFSLWKKNNLAHCFGCNRTVDSIQLVMDIHKKSFKEAILMLTKQI